MKVVSIHTVKDATILSLIKLYAVHFISEKINSMKFGRVKFCNGRQLRLKLT